MFGSNILEVAIGMILVYLLFSLIAAAVREAFTGLADGRGRQLRKGLKELFQGDESLVDDFYKHPQIYALYRGTDHRAAYPAYIPARNFALALMDITARGRDATLGSQAGAEASPLTVEMLRQQVSSLGEPGVQRVMLSALDTANGDIDRVRLALQDWFDSAMDRVSGSYRRITQWWLFAIGLMLATVLDIDSLRIAGTLYRDPAKRQAAVAMAEGLGRERLAPVTRAEGTPPLPRDSAQQVIARSLAEIDSLGLGIRTTFPTAAQWDESFPRGVIGWLITAFAISLGAPFWFDLLNKVMVVRSTVKPKEKSPEEGSEDRQPRPRPVIASPSSPSSPPPPPPPPPPGAQVVVVAGGGGGGAGGLNLAPAENFDHEWAAGDPRGGVL